MSPAKKREAPRRRPVNRGKIVFAAGVGFATAYLFDPSQGRERRARLAEQVSQGLATAIATGRHGQLTSGAVTIESVDVVPSDDAAPGKPKKKVVARWSR